MADVKFILENSQGFSKLSFRMPTDYKTSLQTSFGCTVRLPDPVNVEKLTVCVCCLSQEDQR